MNTKRIVDQFMELCRIPAVSGNEKETAKFCRKILEDIGFSVVEDMAGMTLGGNQGNLIAWMEGRLSHVPPIMLNAHMDTVETGGAIEPEVVGDRIQSKGNTILGADNRAGIVMILEGLRLIRENGVDHGPIEVVLTVGEEAGLLGAEHLDYSKIRSKVGFSLDSSGLGRLGIGAPFYNAIDLKITGRSAHAAVNADQGINSVHLMSKILSQLHFGKIDHETTSNVGQITGGVARNVVPADCRAILEVRGHSLEKLEKETNAIVQVARGIVDGAVVTVDGVEIEPSVHVEIHRECDGFYLAETSSVVKCASAALKQLGRQVECALNMGGSDANVFNSRGMDVVVVGTGQKAVHSYDEYIIINDLTDGVALVPNLIQHWIGWCAQKKT